MGCTTGTVGGRTKEYHSSGCTISDAWGRDALESLRGVNMVWAGDSMLRQVITRQHAVPFVCRCTQLPPPSTVCATADLQLFHVFIHGNLREMPIVVDPVYGSAHYTASLPAPGAEGGVIWDELTANNKDAGAQNFHPIGTSKLEGWDPDTGCVYERARRDGRPGRESTRAFTKPHTGNRFLLLTLPPSFSPYARARAYRQVRDDVRLRELVRHGGKMAARPGSGPGRQAHGVAKRPPCRLRHQHRRLQLQGALFFLYLLFRRRMGLVIRSCTASLRRSRSPSLFTDVCT